MTADQGQYEKFMAKLSKSGLELQKDFSRLSPENQKRFMQEVNQRLKCFGHAVTITDILQSLFRGTSCYLRTPLCKISSTGEIEQRFRLN